MTPDEILAGLFPDGYQVHGDGGVLTGTGRLKGGGTALVIGVAGRTALGVDQAISLSRHALAAIDQGDGPILVLVDSDSQRMSKRDELLGLNEFLSHLAKVLILADIGGRPTIGLLYGHSAAGAFLATALATRVLIALPTADPAVMDLPSMARVTKLPLDVLTEKARSTPVFAPGLDNLARTGAVHVIWDDGQPIADRLVALLSDLPDIRDQRGALGNQRGGRMKAAGIADQVHQLALGRQ